MRASFTLILWVVYFLWQHCLCEKGEGAKGDKRSWVKEQLQNFQGFKNAWGENKQVLKLFWGMERNNMGKVASKTLLSVSVHHIEN